MVELLWPTIFTLLAFGIVVLTGDLFGYADLIVNRGVLAADVARLATLQLVPTLTTTLPFATLVGVLIGLGRLSRDRELAAFETIGLSPWQIAQPCLGFAAAASIFALAMSTVISPASQHAVRQHLVEMAESTPGLALRPGVATRRAGWRLQATHVEDGGQSFSKLLVMMPTLEETIFARRGAIVADPDNRAVLRLEDGIILMNKASRGGALIFDEMTTKLPDAAARRKVPLAEIQTEKLSTLRRRAATAVLPKERRKAAIEVHRRVTHGFSAFPLATLAIALSMRRGRSSRSRATLLGLMGVLTFYILMQIAEGLLRDPNMSIWVALWIPNVMTLAIAAILIGRARRLPRDRRSSTPTLESRVRKRLQPTRWALPRYVGGRFLGLSLACLVGLTLAYTIVDIADNLKWFNKYDATATEIVRFYGARIPVLASRVIPLAMLVGCSLVMSILGSNGELMGMRTCGMNVFRSMMPIWILCMVAVPIDYFVANEIVPRSHARASHINRTEIKNQSMSDLRQSERIWYRSGRDVVEMERRDLLRENFGAVTIYALDETGLPSSRVDADRAHTVGRESWLLENPSRIDLESGRLRRSIAKDGLVEIKGQLAAEIDTAELTPGQLKSMIDRLDLSGIDSLPYQTDLQNKFAAPLACLLLPLLVLCFTSTGPPFPRPAMALMVCVAVAILHAVVSSLAVSMGHGGRLPPLVAGWTPAVVFAAATAIMAIRLRVGIRG